MAAQERLVATPLAKFDERHTTCCYARQHKICVPDLRGNTWEGYALLDDLEEEPDQDRASQARGESEWRGGPAKSVALGARCCDGGQKAWGR